MEQEKTVQVELASHVGRLLRESFGKGPQSIFVSIRRPLVVFYLKGLLSPTEKILLEQDQVLSIQHTRDLLMKTLIPEIKAYTSLLAGIDFQEFYYDWGLHNLSGVFVGVEEADYVEAFKEERYDGKEEFHHEIDNISHLVEKTPEETYSCLLNDRTLLLIRNGILISIEKELIRLGFEGNLKLAKRNLEKSYFHNNNRLESILGKKIMDVFVDWDFHLNKSAIVFVLEPVHN
ncbi:Na-translocating system protein MpsC family protein [Paenibacillus koleovorans]|uniref:Na-translocating system protein MpsC family protein n=1 Tax=Paenibacillus koleovorans TaxID=121608 RepID=UPI000FDCB910|nr:Na-translocating system protein MpsC family protein [Paenibacillus koleovorans]